MLLVTEFQSYAGAQGDGVNYSRQADNLPTPEVIEALKGSGIQVILGTLDADVPTLVNDLAFANIWL
ncbi:hypothetical protein ACFX2I_017133 [Malus domestica]